MRTISILSAAVLFMSVSSADTLTERRISSEDVGTLVFMAPEKWKGIESYDDLSAASVYTLSARREKFELKITVGAAGFGSPDGGQSLDDFVMARLDSYLEYSMAEYVDVSIEGQIAPTRFGSRNHGIYARITDNDPGDDPYVFLTHGARLLGDTLIRFWLYSNDGDESVLGRTIDVISSFSAKQEWANAPDSYLCSVDQIIGFGVVDDEWQGGTSKKVKQRFVVRRSQAGDEFAVASEWVFAAMEDEHAVTMCDNNFIAHGLFVCRSKHDEHFRMDSRTLRFVYAFLGGYHNRAPEDIPGEEDPTPQMQIGTCVPQ